MSLVNTIKVQLGLSNTPTDNFVLDASAANGTMKLARGNAGATSQDILTVDAAGTASFPQGVTGGVTRRTEVATTSGTSVDFTGIPSWVKRITLMLNEVSFTGGGYLRIRLGTSGGIVTLGYSGVGSYVTTGGGVGGTQYTTGFDSYGDSGASGSRSGNLVLANVGGDRWTISGSLSQHAGSPVFVLTFAGSISLGGPLTTVRFTTTAGDAFDAGSVNIMYEG